MADLKAFITVELRFEEEPTPSGRPCVVCGDPIYLKGYTPTFWIKDYKVGEDKIRFCDSCIGDHPLVKQMLKRKEPPHGSRLPVW